MEKKGWNGIKMVKYRQHLQCMTLTLEHQFNSVSVMAFPIRQLAIVR